MQENIDFARKFKMGMVVALLLVLFMSSGPLFQESLTVKERVLGFVINFGIGFTILIIVTVIVKKDYEKRLKDKLKDGTKA
jgi:hypothetical protein